jgi:CCR4-NOT transcription complex subunit 9
MNSNSNSASLLARLTHNNNNNNNNKIILDNNNNQSHHHLPTEISISINNPGLPSGVIVSSNAVNSMGIMNNNSPSLISTSDTQSLNLNNNTIIQGGGKLLLPGSTSSNNSTLPHINGMANNNNMSNIMPLDNRNLGQSENEKVYYLIVDLMSPTTREGALLELSKKREQWDDLALVLWHSFGKPPLQI